MGNLPGPTPISYDWLNQFVLWLGFGDTSDPSENQVRLFNENGKFILKVWNGSEWKHVQPDFDTPISSSVASGTAISLDGGHWIFTAHDGHGNSNIYSGVDEDYTITVNDGGSHVRLDHSGRIKLSVSSATLSSTFTDDIYIEVEKDAGITIQTEKVTHLGTEITLSDSQIHPTGISEAEVGMLMIRNQTYTGQKNGAVYLTGGNLSYEGGVTRLSGQNTYWGTAKGTASHINVFSEDNEIKIENITGVPVTLKYVYIGLS